MRRLAIALALLLTLVSIGRSLAQGEITVVSQNYDNHFPKDITFHLQAQGNQDISKITLYYQIGASTSYAYAYPTFTPGRSVQAEHVMQTSGTRYVTPGSEIKYYYEIEDSGGNKLKTDQYDMTYLDTRFNWKTMQGDQFTVYWYASEQIAQQVFRSSQATLAKMKTEAGQSLQQPVRVWVYRDKQEMDVALPFQSQTTSQDIITQGQAFPDANEVFILGSDPAVVSTTAHELTHLITEQLTSNAFSRIPTWLNEGLSMYAEGELRPANQSALNAAIRNNSLLNLRAMSSLPGRPEQVNLFYGEAYSIVRYLIDTYGSEKMSELLATFKQGTSTSDALMKVYGLSLDQLEANWRAAIGAQPAPSAGAETGASSQPQNIPTIVPFGSKQPQTAPTAEQPQAPSNNTTVYVVLAASAVVLSLVFVVGLAFARRR